MTNATLLTIWCGLVWIFVITDIHANGQDASPSNNDIQDATSTKEPEINLDFSLEAFLIAASKESDSDTDKIQRAFMQKDWKTIDEWINKPGRNTY